METLLKNNRNNVKTNRNYGIDLFKIFSMYLVVVLHVLGQGGILDNTEILSLNYNVAWCLELFAFCAVNCFAVASGYVGITVKYKFSRIISLWFVTVFYGVIINLIFLATDFTPSDENWAASFLPFLYGNLDYYWYFTAYAVTFLFIPFYNFLINNLSKKQATLLIVALVFVFSIVPTLRVRDYFKTVNGYSYAWISALYIIGAYIKKYNIAKNVKTYKIAVLTLISMLITFIGHYTFDYLHVNVFSKDISNEVDEVLKAFLIDRNNLSGSIVANYTFPTILLNSVLFLILFSRINVKNVKLRSKIKKISVLTFSVYLIHTNKLVFDNVLLDMFKDLAKLNPVLMILSALVSALVIFVICLMIDKLRFELFNIIKINELSSFITKKVSGFFNKDIEKRSKETLS